jgi:hypothetical protein
MEDPDHALVGAEAEVEGDAADQELEVPGGLGWLGDDPVAGGALPARLQAGGGPELAAVVTPGHGRSGPSRPRAGGRHSGRDDVADHIVDLARHLEEPVEIDARCDPEVVKEVDQVLRRQVAGRALGER